MKAEYLCLGNRLFTSVHAFIRPQQCHACDHITSHDNVLEYVINVHNTGRYGRTGLAAIASQQTAVGPLIVHSSVFPKIEDWYYLCPKLSDI